MESTLFLVFVIILAGVIYLLNRGRIIANQKKAFLTSTIFTVAGVLLVVISQMVSQTEWSTKATLLVIYFGVMGLLSVYRYRNLPGKE